MASLLDVDQRSPSWVLEGTFQKPVCGRNLVQTRSWATKEIRPTCCCWSTRACWSCWITSWRTRISTDKRRACSWSWITSCHWEETVFCWDWVRWICSATHCCCCWSSLMRACWLRISLMNNYYNKRGGRKNIYLHFDFFVVANVNELLHSSLESSRSQTSINFTFRGWFSLDKGLESMGELGVD